MPLVQTPPKGFEKTRDGLIVPLGIEHRRRLSMTSDQRRLIDRAIQQALVPYDLAFSLRCTAKDCPDRVITITPIPGGSALNCGCTTREIHRYEGTKA